LIGNGDASRMKNAWIVCPAYQEEGQINGLLERLSRVCQQMGTFSFHVLVVDDGSTDRTAQKVEEAAQKLNAVNFDVECISLTRNYGHQAALICGLSLAAKECDLAVTMDADGEQPPELIPELIHKWETGASVVHTARRASSKTPIFRRFTSWAFYRLVAARGIRVRPGMADFKIWDGELLRQIAPYLAKCGSTRLFAAWLAPNDPVIEYEQVVVRGRVSRFTLQKMLSLAATSFFNYSDSSLRVISAFGLISVCFGMAFAVYSLVSFVGNRSMPGWTSMVTLISLFGGIQILSVGALSEYLIYRVFRNNLPNCSYRRRLPPERARGRLQ
jgi:glycosyltransferase involved in cell wall biosynthesis